jgi:hypothetical protein
MFASEPVYTTSYGAIDGYDPVEYFRSGQATRGTQDISAEWGGSIWHFASEANRVAFLAEPERFAPQFGGYCAFGMARGYTAFTDPTVFEVVEGRLYLNFDAYVQTTWRQYRELFIRQAEHNWPAVRPGA